jgi:hypothetical protein
VIELNDRVVPGRYGKNGWNRPSKSPHWHNDMNVRLTAITLAAVLFTTFVAANATFAQELSGPEKRTAPNIFADSEKSPQSARGSDPAQLKADRVAALRQARALYRSQQRIARLEHNLWMGYEPLRPNWNAVPMTSSRYNYRRTIYVPVHVLAR